MRLVDCHAHLFPPLSQACGFPDAETHLLYQQRAMHCHYNQPVRRQRDHQIVGERHLWDLGDSSPSGRATDVDFRVGRYGRFEWDKDGESYYVQFLPPNLQDMGLPPAALIAQMDYAGIDTVVLQNDHIYGDLASHFAAAMAQYPGRFIGLAGIDEAFAYREDQLESLHRAVSGLGMQGLYFSLTGFFRNGYKIHFADPLFDSFWDAVEALKVPVFSVFLGDSPIGDFNAEMDLFLTWLERRADLSCVLVHGLPTALFADERDCLVFPECIARIMDHFRVYAEILYPIAWGGKLDYPYPRAQNHIRQLYERFGPDRLIWGSDMPNVERYCTYRQSLTYLQDYCDFISESDIEKILSTNTLSLFE